MTLPSNIASHDRFQSTIRLSSGDAWEILERLYENARERGDVQACRDLARLGKKFQPTKPKTPKTVFDWVAKSAATGERTRYRIPFVQVTAAFIAATDGHRMHYAPNADGKEPGVYCPKTGAKVDEDDINFPPFLDIIPKAAKKTLSLGDISTHRSGRSTKSVFAFVETPKQGIRADYHYQAISFGDPTAIKTSDKAGDPILYEFEDGRKVVAMPYTFYS